MGLTSTGFSLALTIDELWRLVSINNAYYATTQRSSDVSTGSFRFGCFVKYGMEVNLTVADEYGWQCWFVHLVINLIRISLQTEYKTDRGKDTNFTLYSIVYSVLTAKTVCYCLEAYTLREKAMLRKIFSR